MERVYIFDTTLRDGEQSPGVMLSPEAKLQIAHALSQMGVDVIEAGFPQASPGDFAGVEKIAREISETTICALARADAKDIDAAVRSLRDAEKGRIHVFISTSDIHIESQLRSSRERVLEDVRHYTALAHKSGLEVEFSPMDATRSDRDFVAEACSIALEEGASVLNIPDTVGYATPEEYRGLIEYLADELLLGDAILSVHTHNDLGLAVANSYAGIQGGARQVEASMNGIGERAGNCATEEIAMLLQTRSDRFTSAIRSQEIARTSRLVSKLTGYSVPPNKAIVGRNAFAHESGIHQDGVLKNPETYEIIDPQTVGLASNKLVLGKHSGRHAFAQELESMGFYLGDSALNRAFRAFKNLADKKAYITSSDLEALVSDSARSDARVRLLFFSSSSSSTSSGKAEVVLEKDGQELFYESTGDGPIDALFSALAGALQADVEVTDYRVDSADRGTDAIGEVHVVLRRGGVESSASAVSTDIIEASALAWLRAYE